MLKDLSWIKVQLAIKIPQNKQKMDIVTISSGLFEPEFFFYNKKLMKKENNCNQRVHPTSFSTVENNKKKTKRRRDYMYEKIISL